VQTIYFTTAVAACRTSTTTTMDGMPHATGELPLPPEGGELTEASPDEQQPEERRLG